MKSDLIRYGRPAGTHHHLSTLEVIAEGGQNRRNGLVPRSDLWAGPAGYDTLSQDYIYTEDI